MGPAGWSGLPGHWRRRKAPRSLLHLVITGPEKHPTPSLFTNPLTVTQSGLSLCKHHSLLLIFSPPSCLMFLWPGRGRATACYGGLPVQTAAHRSHCRLHYTAEWRKTHTGLIFLKINICINLKLYFSKISNCICMSQGKNEDCTTWEEWRKARAGLRRAEVALCATCHHQCVTSLKPPRVPNPNKTCFLCRQKCNKLFSSTCHCVVVAVRGTGSAQQVLDWLCAF